MGKSKAAGKKGAAKTVQDDDDALLDAALQEVGAVRTQAEDLGKEGDEMLARGEWGQAVSQFTKAIELDPGSTAHLIRRSAAYLFSGPCQEALNDAKAAVTLAGSSVDHAPASRCQLGNVLFKNGQLQAAKEEYEKGLKACPTHAGCQQGRDEVTVAMERDGICSKQQPVAETGDIEVQELMTLPAPEEVLGKGFEVVHLCVGESEEPVKFLLSTTMTSEAMITPTCCNMLKIPIKRSVDLENVRFAGGPVIGTLKDCAVTGFMQSKVAEKALGSVLHGMLGLPFLARYDVKLDRIRKEQRFQEPGSIGVNSASPGIGSMELRGIEMPSDFFGVPAKIGLKQGDGMPVLGVVDTSSMFSLINWQAAKELGIADGPEDPKLENVTKVVGPTKEGPKEMPLVHLKVRLCSSTEAVQTKIKGGFTKEEFEAKGKGNGWMLDIKKDQLQSTIEFGRVNAAIGDAIQFDMLSNSTVGEYVGGAMLLGQDVLAQALRLTISFKDKAVQVTPPGRIADAPVV